MFWVFPKLNPQNSLGGNDLWISNALQQMLHRGQGLQVHGRFSLELEATSHRLLLEALDKRLYFHDVLHVEPLLATGQVRDGGTEDNAGKVLTRLRGWYDSEGSYLGKYWMILNTEVHTYKLIDMDL